MLASPRLETGMRAFFDDMLRFDDLVVLAKDPGIYPVFGAETIVDAREQTLRTLVDHLLVRKLDYRDLFTSRDTFISPSLAVIYDVAAPPGWTAYTSPPDSARAGLLTQVSFLAAHAHPGRSSPTLRGKAVRELLLCQTVPRPPPNVDFSLLEDADSRLKTARERLDLHRTNPVCAGCHKITDPIGLAFENFDGAGQFRATERGAAIDASGVLDGQNFDDLADLSQVVHDHPQLSPCLVKRVYGWATGGRTQPTDKPMLDWLGEQFAADGYRLADLLRTVALSSAFATVRQPVGWRKRTMIRNARLARLSRRRVLKGMLNGAAVTVGLPLLDCMLSDSGRALASGAPMPLRFVTWFWGLGGASSVFVPKKTGAGLRPARRAAAARARQAARQRLHELQRLPRLGAEPLPLHRLDRLPQRHRADCKRGQARRNHRRHDRPQRSAAARDSRP